MGQREEASLQGTTSLRNEAPPCTAQAGLISPPWARTQPQNPSQPSKKQAAIIRAAESALKPSRLATPALPLTRSRVTALTCDTIPD